MDMTKELLKAILVAGSAVVGAVCGTYTAVKENTNKDDIIEDLSDRYNELVESINNGTLDTESMEDVDWNDDSTESEEDDKDEVELRLGAEIPEDIPDLEYYPSKFIDECTGAQNRIQILYTDIENCNDGEIEFTEDQLLDQTNAEIAMICTAYQSAYSTGLALYFDALTARVKAIKKIRNYDSSIKNNKAFLVKDIEIILDSAKKFNDRLQLNMEKQLGESSETESDDDLTVPVYHKKGAV